jgi:hypothetical protein
MMLDSARCFALRDASYRNGTANFGKARSYPRPVAESLQAVLAFETFDAPGGIDQALLPGIEGMAVRAYFNANFRQSGTRFKGIAACAGNPAAAVYRMGISFHFLCVSRFSRVLKTV